MKTWYQETIPTVLERLAVDPRQGLADAEAARRLAQSGPNELIERGIKSPWKIFWEQLTSTLVVVLIIAGVVSGLLGDLKDTAAILAIVILNAVLGFRQEYRAERAMAALKRLAAPSVRVRRAGSVKEISARDLTPGDIVLLEAGNLVPADARLLVAANLRVQEAALTGESEPVEKDPTLVFSAELPTGDRRNMVYLGTMVIYGHGEALVTATGMQTELGRIADLIQTVEDEPTPLQRRLDQLGRQLAAVALAIVLVIFGLGLLRGDDWMQMLLIAVSMAVAAVPEGLPAVVTIALALGAQRMLKRHALIRKLPAVETLGSVTVICSDKTGTLTENQMTVTVLAVAGEQLDVAEHLRRRTGSGETAGAPSGEPAPALQLLAAAVALCNDAVVAFDAGQADALQMIGDPTEGALAVAAARLGMLKTDLEEDLPRVAEEPFDSVRKRMTTIHCLPRHDAALPVSLPISLVDEIGALRTYVGNGATEGATESIVAAGAASAVYAPPLPAPGYVAFTKGAYDLLLSLSTHVWLDGAAQPLDAARRRQIAAAHDELAGQGMRVLGVAFRLLHTIPKRPIPKRHAQPNDAPNSAPADSAEHDLTFLGLVAMIDPPRQEVREAVAVCRRAGIRPVMITGDHPLTARHIAQQLGIDTSAGLLSGQELEQMSEGDLDCQVEQVAVYARVSPEHKLRIVQALQRHGHIVAMTGDGVNDAPALKQADIGVAMGITGTDVAKEAAEMVLQDDNFATIVAAVEEGRTIYDNIRKFIRYLLSCNSGEIWVMLLAPFLGMPLPLLPLQILWMNLVTDGLPALALGVEPAEQHAMQRPPYAPDESIFSRGLGWSIIWVGLLLGIGPLALGYFYRQAGHPAWQTITFTALVLSQMALALAVRSERQSLFRQGLSSNRALLGAVLLTVVLQIGVIYAPLAQAFFETQAMSLSELVICLSVCTLPFWGIEIEKWLRRSPQRDVLHAI